MISVVRVLVPKTECAFYIVASLFLNEIQRRYIQMYPGIILVYESLEETSPPLSPLRTFLLN
jgi:hypothetical protein